MIITRSPLRLEFLGGSTDLKSFYVHHTGWVLNAALNKYVYVTVNKSFSNEFKISCGEDHQVVDSIEKIQNPIIKAALKLFNIKEGLEITSLSDVPSGGSGLGSSSAFTIGLVHALSVLVNKNTTPKYLAETASHIEIDILKSPIGKQDQYASAFGGINLLMFNKKGQVMVNPINLTPAQMKKLHDHLILFYIGKARSTNQILKKQEKNITSNLPYLKSMADLVTPASQSLKKGDLKSFASFLFQEWTIKKYLQEGITSPEIENMYNRAVKAGVWGGRLSGAGGSGFMELIIPPSKQNDLKKTLTQYQQLDCKIVKEGSKLILKD